MSFTILGYTFSTATPAGYISIGILAFCLLCVISGILFGLRRGFGKTVIRLLTVTAAAVMSYFLSVGVSDLLVTLFEGKSLEELLRMFVANYDTAFTPQYQEAIANFDAETLHYAISLVLSTLILPIAFVIVFYILKAVLLLVYWILSSILGIVNRDKGFFSTIGGALAGVVQGAVIAICVLIPVSGVLSLAGEFREEVKANEDIPSSTVARVTEFYAWWLDDAIDNPLTELVAKSGGETVYAQLTLADVDGVEYDMREQAKALAYAVVDAGELGKLDWKAPKDHEKAAMRRIEADVGENPYLASMLAGLLRGSASALSNDPELLLNLDEPYRSLFVEALKPFTGSTAITVDEDLATLLEVYFIMGDEGLLTELGEGDYETVKSLLISKNEDGKLVIDRIIAELNKDVRMANLVNLFATLSVSIMTDSLSIDEEAQELYENVKTELAQAITINADDYETEEEYRTAVNETVSSALTNNNINLDKEIVDSMSDFIAENYRDTTEITDADINAAIFSYYASYAGTLEGVDEDDIGDIISGELGNITGGDVTEGDGSGELGNITGGDVTEGDGIGDGEPKPENGEDVTDGEPENGEDITDGESTADNGNVGVYGAIKLPTITIPKNDNTMPDDAQ